MTQGWIFQGHFPCSRKVPEAFFLLKGWNCVPLAKGPKFGTDGNFAGSSYSLHVAWRRGLCSTDCKFSRGRWKKDANLSMDDLLNSNKKLGFWRSSCGVWAALHQVLQVALLWETLAAPVSGPTSCASWVEHAGIFEQSHLHFVFQLLEYASSIVMYCVHVPVQLLGWNVAQLASMKKRSLRYVKPKIHVESHILHHGCKQVKIKILYSRVHFRKILNAQSEIELTIKLSQDPEYQVLQVAGCEMMLVLP